MHLRRPILVTMAALAGAGEGRAGERLLDAGLHHLRAGDAREWSHFPAAPEGPGLVLRFQAERNAAEGTLRIRQQDVKQTWKVILNGKELGRLVADENDMFTYMAVPEGRLVDGENTLAIEQVGKTPDDIRLGEIGLHDRPQGEVLSEATVTVRVRDGDRPERLQPLPCRITVLEKSGALAALRASSGEPLAVRTGVIYTGTGAATFGLRAGEYTIHAGRGFEYGIDSASLMLRPGDAVQRELVIRREVPTEGYVSCDPHIHTLTHSGHGDATEDERVLTLAGEGIELAIATEHNLQVDYHEAAVRLGVRRHFTPVVGNEVTTAAGHFNVFPVRAGGPLPDHEAKGWEPLFASIDRAGARVVILNHARDIHSRYRPFGPEHHNAATGKNLDGWALGANAMEVVNSGAQQTDSLRLLRDWFALLNRGAILTPVGASDSHDVSRFIVGQGRTYIRAKDDSPGEIDAGAAVESFLAGRVLVSCGLLVDITVGDRYGPGDLAPAAGEVKVAARVLGPGWVEAERVELYANGIQVREAMIPGAKAAGVKWSGVWTLPRFHHDVHLVAVATGPGVRDLYWPIALPYQPASPAVDRRVMGASGAVWIDGDGDGKRTCARDHARGVLDAARADFLEAVRKLAACDEAVAVQAAGLLEERGVPVEEIKVLGAAREAGPHVERGFQAFLEARRESQTARVRPPGS